MDPSSDATANLCFFVIVAGVFTAVMGLNWFILAHAPKRPSPKHPMRVLASPHDLAKTLEVMQTLTCFTIKRELDLGGRYLLVLNGPMTSGLSFNRTYGHWLFVEVAPADEAVEVRLSIKTKWIESGTKQRERMDGRLATLAEEAERLLSA